MLLRVPEMCSEECFVGVFGSSLIAKALLKALVGQSKASSQKQSEIEDGQARNFHENAENIFPSPKSATAKNTPKIPEDTRIFIPLKILKCPFWVFSGIFGVFSRGSRISGQGVFLRHFSWTFRV